jgi:hypothetical protein
MIGRLGRRRRCQFATDVIDLSQVVPILFRLYVANKRSVMMITVVTPKLSWAVRIDSSGSYVIWVKDIHPCGIRSTRVSMAAMVVVEPVMIDGGAMLVRLLLLFVLPVRFVMYNILPTSSSSHENTATYSPSATRVPWRDGGHYI